MANERLSLRYGRFVWSEGAWRRPEYVIVTDKERIKRGELVPEKYVYNVTVKGLIKDENDMPMTLSDYIYEKAIEGWTPTYCGNGVLILEYTDAD